MKFRRALFASLFITMLIVFTTGWGVAAFAAEDQNGREWRQLYETTGLSWNQIAEVCPRDGVTPCSGSVGGKDLTGWVWGTDEQVIEFMGEYAPDLLTADPPEVSGDEYFVQALGFLSVMRWTVHFSNTYHTSEWTGGWTSSMDESGAPIGGGVGFAFPIFNGQFGVGPAGTADVPDPDRGVWMWRTAGLDYSAPVITPSVSGTAGSNGWYVSNVSVTWDVNDAESPIDSMTGCDAANVTTDTSDATFECEATSFGGTAHASTTVKRDATAPTVTCGSPTPELELGELGLAVSASVTDATSGPASPTASAIANTSSPGSFTAKVTGSDRAGNTTTKDCPYKVVIPPCQGFAPTIVGTVGNDTINGTEGRDVIVSSAGNDTIYGKGGNDIICAGDGADVVNGDAGNDKLGGQDGPDTITGGAGKDGVDGGVSDDSLFGSGGDDYLNGGANNDSIRGDDGRDTCTSGEIRMSSCEVIRP